MSIINELGGIILKFVLILIFYLYSTFTFIQTIFYSKKPKERVIIFTRFPQENSTKKRLIPKFGAKFAANLQKEMTSFIVKKVSLIQVLRETEIYIYYTHNDQELDYKNEMKEWLGDSYNYIQQNGKDLGEKLINSVRDAFDSGIEKVVIIGSDIPDINHHILDRSFNILDKMDAVIGPAKDGGYYLIGLKNGKEYETIFKNVIWGTSSVYEETISRFKNGRFKWGTLDILEDIDEPEDVVIWEKSKSKIEEKEKISVIIPTFNEEEFIEKSIKSLKKYSNNIEIIVVDGGSDDETVNIVKSIKDVSLYEIKGGKSIQMNFGAKNSSGDILLFLHADTIVPTHFDTMIRETVKLRKTSLGAFSFGVSSDIYGIKTMEKFTNWRCRQLQLPYGDQGLFLYKKDFKGYKEIPFMEDYEFVKRYQEEGIVRILNSPCITSARRWEKNGVFYSVFLNQIFILLYNFGVSPQTLKLWYYGKNK